MIKEKRNYLRCKAELDVNYSISDLHYNGKLIDICQGGMFINSYETFAIGNDICLSIKIPNSSTSFRIHGYITRNEDKGFGVKFKEPMNALGFSEDHAISFY